MINDEILERIGKLVDTADNYLALNKMPLKKDMRIDSMKSGLDELKKELKQLYFDLGGEDVWEVWERNDDPGSGNGE